MEILEKWGIKPVMMDVMEGFGVIRSRLIHECGCDWSMIIDADERLPVIRHTMTCSGSEKYPDTPNPNVTVTKGIAFDQMKALRSMIENADGFDAIVMPRFHWMDASLTRPAQNWNDHRDLQCRLVRNLPNIGYKPERKIHEHIVDAKTGGEPNMLRQGHHEREVVIYHLHNHFKPMEGAQNAEDLATYRALDESLTKGMWLENAKQA